MHAHRSSNEVSVIVTAHAEGRLLHPCLRSVERAAAAAEAEGVKVERLLVLSHPTPPTLAWADEFLPPQWRRLDCPIDDPWAARNLGVENCNGNYVSFIDGDDLWCEQWLVKALREAESAAPPAVWHPEISFYFGATAGQLYHPDALRWGFDYSTLLDRNVYSSSCFVPKSILAEIPFVAADWERGIGFGDWHWNCEIVAAGYEHRTVLETWDYVRTYAHLKALSSRMTAAGLKPGPTNLFNRPIVDGIVPTGRSEKGTL